MMVERGLTADEFCLHILQKQIDDLGTEAFAHTGIVMLYSGPAPEIREKTVGVVVNPVRSANQAEKLGATRIDDTAIGTFLESVATSDYFRETYGNKEDAGDAVQEVWAYASRQFMRTGFREVATAVCGAAPDRVFRAHELKVVLTEDTAIETINGVSIQYFKDIYKEHSNPENGFYAAFVEICKTELEVAHQRALSATGDDQDQAWEDYSARKLFFDLEQEGTEKLTAVYDTLASTLSAMIGHKTAITGSVDPSRPVDLPVTIPTQNAAHGH